MNRIIFLLLCLALSSCADVAPSGYVWIVKTEKTTFECTKMFRNEDGSVRIKMANGPWVDMNNKIISITVVRDHESNIGGYTVGYKDGQIDAINGKICLVRMTSDAGEVFFQDTCKHK